MEKDTLSVTDWPGAKGTGFRDLGAAIQGPI